MDNWLKSHRKADGHDRWPYCMGYYKRDDIPFQFGLPERLDALARAEDQAGKLPHPETPRYDQTPPVQEPGSRQPIG